MSPDPNKGIESDNNADIVKNNKDVPKKQDYTMVYVFAAIILLLGVFAIYQYTDLFTDDGGLINGNGDSIERFSYNDHHFVKNTIGQYTTAVKGFTLPDGSPYSVHFRNTPMEVENISIDGNFTEFLPSNKTYISLDISEVEGNTDMIKSVSNLALSLASTFYPIQGNQLMNPVVACNADNDPSCSQSDIVTCESDPDKKVIELMYSDENRIEAQGNCIRLLAKEGEMSEVVDRLFYDWYRIIDRN